MPTPVENAILPAQRFRASPMWASSPGGCLRGFSSIAVRSSALAPSGPAGSVEVSNVCFQLDMVPKLFRNKFSFPDMDQVRGSRAQLWPPHTGDLRRAKEPRVHTGQVGDCAHQLFWGVCHDFHEELHYQFSKSFTVHAMMSSKCVRAFVLSTPASFLDVVSLGRLGLGKPLQKTITLAQGALSTIIDPKQRRNHLCHREHKRVQLLALGRGASAASHTLVPS